MTVRVTQTPGFWAASASLFVGGLRLVRSGGAKLAAVVLVTQLVILGISLPLVHWLFREALRAAGMTGLDLGQLQITGGLPFSLGLIVIICTLAFWIVALQFTVLIVAVDQVTARGSLSLRGLGGELVRLAKKLVRPSSLALLGYLFVVLPLSGFGFLSALTHGIAVPRFVTGELSKSATGSTILIVFFVGLAVANLLLAASLPLFALTDATGGRALRGSLRLTWGVRGLSLALAIVGAMIVASAAGAALTVVAILPTLVTDAAAPALSPAVAAFSLGAVRVAGAVLAGVVAAWIAGILVVFVRRHRDRVPAQWLGMDRTTADATGSVPHEHSRGAATVVVSVSVLAAVALGLASLGPMQRISEAPQTLSLAHRGFTPGGIENTLESLDAAAEAGVDMVEVDFMQTADRGFVAMHDATLGRLAGEDVAVKDLTTPQLQALTLRDALGHTSTIPTVAEYVTRADELDLPLLIEIKLGGGETDDHVDLLVAELEELGLLERNIYHSLDAASVARLKTLRPDLTVGYTMAFAGDEAPDTPADFIVVEQWTASEAVQASAERKGYGFWVWTVNDDAGIREHFRRGAGGIISDVPDRVVEIRAEMAEETGLAGRLLDAMRGFITVG
ncbi:glycerophosphoryl diester phosphodiesterase membrane domain-containing protein [Microbacterium sp. NPDC055357]